MFACEFVNALLQSQTSGLVASHGGDARILPYPLKSVNIFESGNVAIVNRCGALIPNGRILVGPCPLRRGRQANDT